MDAQLNIKTTASFCFNKDDFISSEFSVDRFVSDCRKYASLDTMRDDLSMYQKILCSAMIELINKDYADFVNLSSNLVGLDKSIKSLSVPLESLKSEVDQIKESFKSTLNTTHKILSERESSHTSKVLIYHIISVQESLEKISHLETKIADSKDIEFEVLERISLLFNLLQFHTATIADLSGHSYKKETVKEVEQNLLERLEFALLQSLLKHDVPNLQKVLQIYSIMNKENKAEECFQKSIVKPFLKNIMTKSNISKDGLEKTLNDVLSFILNSCSDVLKITSGTTREVETVPGYDFLVNAVWPEIHANFESISPVYLYSFGDPFELFHQNYTSGMKFLDKFEHQCSSQSSVRRLREQTSYKEFIEKWNLDVYFEIRFQEIASELEKHLNEKFVKSNDEKSDFILKTTIALWNCINQCWNEQIFLPFLSSSFLKLTFQLLSRYRSWAHCNLKQTSDNTVEIVYLVNDVEILVSKLKSFFPQIVYSKVNQSAKECIEAAVQETLHRLEEVCDAAEKVIVKVLTGKCSSQLKMIAGIPQRFRKTNREVPSKPSPYVSQVINHVTQFLSETEDLLSLKWRKSCQLQVTNEILKQCISLMRDVLTSIKKMEDSLKILKRARDKPTGQFSTGAVSDDDKIRRQLAIDVSHFEELILKSGLKIEEIKTLQELKDLVTTAERTSSQVNA